MNGRIGRCAIPLAALVAAVIAVSNAAAQGVGLPLGTQGPPAPVQTMDGKPADLADYVGKGPVLIEFWATWCANCEELEPAMAAAKKKYGDRVRFLGVAVSLNQSPARVKAYAERHQLPIEVLWDVEGKAADAYRAPATSYVVVLDAAGKVVYTGVGGKQDLDAAIGKALAPTA
jgi:thiol-disulfide isomerase/thioredoxin